MRHKGQMDHAFSETCNTSSLSSSEQDLFTSSQLNSSIITNLKPIMNLDENPESPQHFVHFVHFYYTNQTAPPRQRQPTNGIRSGSIQQRYLTHFGLSQEVFCSSALFVNQPYLLDLYAHIKVIGMHQISLFSVYDGHFQGLIQFFQLAGLHYDICYLFISNYVDHGSHSIQTIVILIHYEIISPYTTFILRGYHNNHQMNRFDYLISALQIRQFNICQQIQYNRYKEQLSAKMLKKPSIKQQSLNSNDQDIQFCFFCNKKAEFKCSECLQATYCTPQHQKADWPSHKRRCIRPEDKLKDLYRHLQTYKKLFFEKLSKRVMNECESIGDNILKISEQILTKFPSPLHEIQYGTAICCYVKMLLSVKSFNEAQQILNNYFKQRNDFLTDTSTIPQKIEPQNPNYNNIIKFVEGKLKLLSVLCNLAHQTVRNSVDMIQILLRHCQKFYGPTSLQVSNVYFQLGNYFFFLNQSMKACACYLIAGDMRKEKGVCAYYNAAIILMKNTSFTQSIRFLQKCLSMVLTNGDPNQLIDRIYLALANCYKKLNHFDFTVHYLERALCQINLKNRFDKTEKPHIQKLLKGLSEEYRKQFNNDQILSLPREKPVPERQPIISNANLEDFWDLDANNDKKKKADEWIKSFKNEKQKTKFESKIPMSNPLLQKVLFVNHFIDEKNDEGNATPANKSSNAYEYINIDLEFMERLTATEVRFMNQLNRLLVINKDKPNLHDVIENSNLMQELSKEKIQRFYQLNPELMRQKEDYNLMSQEQQQPYQQSADRKGGEVQTEPKIKTPRLDLSKVPKNT